MFPSQAPDFINQTILNKFWELVHLMFIGIAVSYGLFGRRNVDNGNYYLDDSQSYVSGMSHVSSIFEDGFDHSMYYSGQGKGGFFNVKKGGFENPYYEENFVQAWSSKYFQGEPLVVLAQPNCGLEKYGESGSFIDYKPLGLPVRSLKTRVGSRGSLEFENGSSESSGSSVKDSLDSSDKSRSGRFGDLGSENMEGKFNESDVLGSPIPWRSRSGRMRERVRSGDTRPSHFRPLSVDETQFESLNSRSLRSTVSFSSQVSSQSQSQSTLSPSHSNSSESHTRPSHFRPHSVDETQFESLNSRSLRSTVSFSSQVSSQSHSQSTLSPSHSNSSESHTRPSHFRPHSVDETQFESLNSRSLRSTVSFSSQVSSQSHSPCTLSPSHSNSSESRTRPSHFRPHSVDETQFESLNSRSLRSTVSFSSQVSSQSHSPCTLSPSHSNSSESHTRPSHFRPLSVDETQFESLNSRSLRSTVSFSSQVSSQSHSPCTMSPSHSNSSESPKSKMSPCRTFPPTSPSIPRPLSSKASVTAAHSRQYSDGSLLGTHERKCFEDELKELCGSKRDDPSSSKELISGSLKFDAKPAASSSKASSRGKSVRTFRTSRPSGNNTIGARDAGEKQENHTKGKLTMGFDEIEEAYTSESEPKIEVHNNLSVGFNRQNLGGDSYMPKPTSPKNQKRGKQECSENSAAESREDTERKNEDFQVSSDEETMSGTFSVAGSDTYEVDRKAGEFIAKFKEQIRLQRTTSIDSPRGLNITGNYFR
ncbi:hypothetical protein REPUB_Repub12eG0201700 [Reevesia pubescens]